MSSQLRRVQALRRAVFVLVASAGVLAAGSSVDAFAAATPKAAPHCTVDFSTSTQTPGVGQDITLRWQTSGADLLVASWTTAPLPFSGTQVTTKSSAGPASYQVTGLKAGQYCGGGVVNVVFGAAAPSSSAPSSSPTSPTGPASSAPVSTPAPTSASSSVAYPAQSPTGGSGIPWWEQPADLAAIGVLSLLGAAGLMRRERLRAVFARRH